MEEKKIKGRKRHISVDVLGLLICVSVHSAAISDREGAKLVIARALAICPTIQLFWADGGYTGKLITWVMLFFQRTLDPSWNTKKTKPLAHAGYKVPGYVLGVPQI